MSLRQLYTSKSTYSATGSYQSATGSFGTFVATGFSPVVVSNPNVTTESVIFMTRSTGTASGLTGAAWVDSIFNATGSADSPYFTVRAQPGDVNTYRYTIVNSYPL
jgi:hypothetical protein